MSNTSFISKTPHPLLLSCPGTSQQGKILEQLDPKKIKIDDQEAEDLLNFIYQFANQVNFYDESLQQHDWQPFFKNSLPFVLAQISKLNQEQLKADYDELVDFVKTDYEPQSLQLIFDFLYDEVFMPLTKWQQQFTENKSSFGDVISAAIRRNLKTALKNYIKLFNGAAFIDGTNTVDDYNISARNFTELDVEKIWGLKQEDLTAQDTSFYDDSNNTSTIERLEAILEDGQPNLNAIVNKAIEVLKVLSEKAPHYIKESLIPKYEEQQQLHLPQLGLLYTFIELSKHFKIDVNDLSTKHLDFFYKKVLNIKEQPETPDKAHLVFELQKHVEEKELKAGTLIKNGKDANNKDIFFQLDEDVVIDKAQVAHLQTLHVNYVDAVIEETTDDEEGEDNDGDVPSCSENAIICSYVEGIYMAPVANAANGIEETKPPLSWPTLGSRFSKETIGDNELPERYPKAEVGFVLASPVLYLQEGKRKIDIRLCCKIEDIEGVKEFDKINFVDLELAFGQSGLGEVAGVDLDGDGFPDVQEIIDLNETFFGLTASVIEEIQQQLLIQVKPKIEDWLDTTGGNWSKNYSTLIQYIFNEWWGISSIDNLAEDFYNVLYENLFENLNADLYGIDVCPIGASSLNAYSAINLDLMMEVVSDGVTLEQTATFEGEFPNEDGFFTITNEDGTEISISEDDVIYINCLIEESIKCFEELARRIIEETADTQKVFKICLSGEKEWIVVKPEEITKINLICPTIEGNGNSSGGFECPPNTVPPVIILEGDGLNEEDPLIETDNESPLTESTEFACPTGTDYELCITIELDESVDPVTFFNEKELKEPLGTTDPVAKILVNGDIKIPIDSCEYIPCCSLENCEEEKELTASLYHYFRHFKVLDSCIDVEVCGLKNFIVQNDENLQDVNSPVYPFGVRPEVIDFNVVNIPMYYLTNNIIQEIVNTGVAINIFNPIVDNNPLPYEIGPSGEIDSFIALLDIDSNDPDYTSIVFKIKDAFGLAGGGLNLIGPDFYIGSKEIFCKDWHKVWVNFAWKGKPGDFNDYYKAYLVDWNNAPPTLGLNEKDFEINLSVLNNGAWIRENNFNENNYRLIERDNPPLPPADTHPITGHFNRELFQDNRVYFNSSNIEAEEKFIPPYCIPIIETTNDGGDVIMALEYPENIKQVIEIDSRYFDIEHKFRQIDTSIVEYRTDTLNGFLKFTLENQDFLHKDYAFVLARQMMALSGITDTGSGAILLNSNTGGVYNIGEFTNQIQVLQQNVADINTNITSVINTLNSTSGVGQSLTTIQSDLNAVLSYANDIKNCINVGADSLMPKINSLKGKIENIRSCLFDAEDIAEDEINVQFYIGSTLVNLGDLGNEDISGAQSNIENALAKLGNLSNLENDDIPGLYDTNTNAFLVSGIPASPADTNLWDIIVEALNNLTEISDKIKDTEPPLPPYDPNNPNDTIFQKICAVVDRITVDIIPLISSVMGSINIVQGQSQTIQLAAQSATTIVGVPGSGGGVTPVDDLENAEVPIPNEPWTPIIKEMSLDYTAKATRTDIDLIHIYPFSNTYKEEPLNPQPMLVPTLVDEGTLFIGLKDLKPGSSVNLLFQLAEATANTECDKADIKWHYLKNNRWNNELREGFEIAEDGTNGLTRSGIVKIAIPEDMPNKGYTIMPNPEPDEEPLSWLKVSARKNIAAICETVGIHTQAVVASYKNMSNRREKMLLPTGSLSRLASADSRIKKVNQLYDTYGGRLAEQSNIFYHRVSERLRHKGRGIQLFDYERLVLQHFPQVLMVRCVTHTFGLSAKKYRSDLSIAPGFVMLALIPNLKLLASGNILEPRVSTSLLDDIQAMLADKISPFTRLKVVNPRYEKVDVTVKVKFKKKITNVAFYRAKLAESLMQLLAPWTQGDNLDRLVFGRNLSASEIVEFIECRPYVDFICSLDLKHEDEKKTCYSQSEAGDTGDPTEDNNDAEKVTIIAPLTARSILTVGTINVEHLSRDCDKFSTVEGNECDNVTSMKK